MGREAVSVGMYIRRRQLVLEGLRRGARRQEGACYFKCGLCSATTMRLCPSDECYCVELYEFRDHYGCARYDGGKLDYVAVRKDAGVDELVEFARAKHNDIEMYKIAKILRDVERLRDMGALKCDGGPCKSVRDILAQLVVLGELFGGGP